MKKLLFSLISIFSFITLVGSQKGPYERIFEEQKKRDFEDSLFFQTEEDPFALSNYFLYGNPSERFKRLYQFPLSDVRKFLKEEQQKRIDALDAYLDSQMKDNLRIIKEYEDKNKNDLGQTDLDESISSENGEMSELDSGMAEKVNTSSPLQIADDSDDSMGILGTDYEQKSIGKAEAKKKRMYKLKSKKEFMDILMTRTLFPKKFTLESPDFYAFFYDSTYASPKYNQISKNIAFYGEYLKCFFEEVISHLATKESSKLEKLSAIGEDKLKQELEKYMVRNPLREFLSSKLAEYYTLLKSYR